MSTLAPVGVIGGSGFYSLLEDPELRPVPTPYGEPSAPLALGTLADRPVAFLPRHGADHRFAPHRVPYRANLWALRSAGVAQVISLSAVGSLTPELDRGALVVPDQVADRTWGRAHTYFDADAGVGHSAFADPYCPVGRDAAVGSGEPVAEGGTLVVINGPRFSSRAESQEYQGNGWRIIGMTGMPEAALARELALCFTVLALVTDLDAGVDAGTGVTHAEVLAEFGRNLPRLRELLVATLRRLPEQPGAGCDCAAGAAVPVP